MGKLALTDRAVRDLPLPAKGNRIHYDDPAGNKNYVRGFAVRVTAAGTRTFLLCYVTAEGRERRQKIGDLGPFTVTTAREDARQLRAQVDRGCDPMAEVQAKRVDGKARRERESVTLGGLLLAYADALERAKKPSAAEVRRHVRTSVEKALPDIWKRPIDATTVDDLNRILHSLMKMQKWRQAEKLRAYIASAYGMAARSRYNPANSDLFAEYADVSDIGRSIVGIERPKLPDDHEAGQQKRALTHEELAAYWKRISTIEGATGALLRFHLLTGAQRCEQLARLKAQAVSEDAVTLLDAKGRRTKARRHVIPLIPEAAAALKVMRGDAGPYVFSLDCGESGAPYHKVRLRVQEVAEAMLAAKEVKESFTPGELRITVETRLQAAGVASETRAHLQSHGLGGVQNKHYAKHDFMEEKRAALETLRALCEPKRDNVTPIKRRKRA